MSQLGAGLLSFSPCRAPVPSLSRLRAWTLSGKLTPSEGGASSLRLVQRDPSLCFLNLCGSKKRCHWLKIFPGKGDMLTKCFRYVPISKGLVCKKSCVFWGRNGIFKNPRIYMIPRAHDAVFCSFHIKSTLVSLGTLLTQQSPALHLALFS